jgi:hypothetical protein
LEDGLIVGRSGPPGGVNTFLTTDREYADLELELEVKCDAGMNSGIQIRSRVYERDTPQASQPSRMRQKGEVYGYQCEIAANERCTAGNFWDEAREMKWHDDLTNKPGACRAFKPGEWNHFRIVAEGDHIRSWVNGIACADFRGAKDRSGFVGLQVHRTREPASFEVRFRNVRIRELGRP